MLSLSGPSTTRSRSSRAMSNAHCIDASENAAPSYLPANDSISLFPVLSIHSGGSAKLNLPMEMMNR